MQNTAFIAAVKELVAAPSCNAYLKGEAERYLANVATAEEPALKAKLIAQCEADIMPIDGLIGFADSEAGVKVFGAELAAQILAHAKDIKAQGATHCDCPACAACKKIIDLK